jgi:mannose-6-phosphate isomerase-like protein (cupin superfamily)
MVVRAGDEAHNPLTGSRLRILEAENETAGLGFTLEVLCPPGAGPDVLEHFHLDWTERFAILAGVARYRLDGDVRTVEAGETLIFPPLHRHVHPWNGGDTELVYRQETRFRAPSPQAVQDTLGVFSTLYRMAAQGETNARGLPKNPLQLAVTMKLLIRHGGFDAAIPVPVQRVVAATLGSLAERLGYSAVDGA